MGNSSSSAAHGGDDPLDPFDGVDTLGYRVLGVQPNSPAAKAGLVSFLDFLVGVDQKMLLGSGEGLEEGQEYDDVDLPAFLDQHKNKEVEFLVWNIKSQQQRLVQLTPGDDWGGAGLLGVTIRLDNYAGAEERLIRVLEVEPQSPAAVAGLVPHQDFLLGTTHQTLDTTETLARLLHEFQDRVVELYVYNVDSDVVRVVALMPTLSWGGMGLLGAEVGVGYLHRLPHKVRGTSGASVQRKVRYVTGPPSSSETKEQATLLEMEPQLEMEPDEEESSTTDMSSVALDDASLQSTPQQPETPRSDQAVGAPGGATSDDDDDDYPIASPAVPQDRKVFIEESPGMSPEPSLSALEPPAIPDTAEPRTEEEEQSTEDEPATSAS